MTKCPKCKEHALYPSMIAEGLSARGCQRCAGALVDLVTYRSWAEQQGIDTIDTVGQSDTAVDDSRAAVLCPHCERIMTKFRVSSDTDNRLDFCNHCDVAWLDRGEWTQLQEMGLRSHLGSVFSEPWQRRVRESESMRLSEQQLEARFGDDFDRIRGFKTWLESRPDRDDIVGWLAFSASDK